MHKVKELIRQSTTTQSVESFPEEWYDLNDANHFWFQWRLRAFLGLVTAMNLSIKAPRTFLDIGCGVGLFADQVEHSTAWTIDRCDLNVRAVSDNQPARGQAFVYDVLTTEPGRAGHYDGIFLFDVIEHIDDTRAFIEAAVEHVRPGGQVFVNVPALPKLFSEYDSAVGHLRRYTKESLREEFAFLSSDLVIDDVRFWGMSLIPVVIARKAMLKKGTERSEIVKAGFKPPSKLLNDLMCGLMALECTLVRSPLAGTSLLLAATKRG